MIKPTIGRVVLVNSGAELQKQWLAGTVVYVHEDETINVSGFEPTGRPFIFIGLELRQGPITQDPVNIPLSLIGQRFACWMPYQREQAEKSGGR